MTDAKEQELIEAVAEACRKLDEDYRKLAEARRKLTEADRKRDEAYRKLREYRKSNAQQGGKVEV